MNQNEKDALPKLLRPVSTISIFVCTGSYIGLKFLGDKETLFWMKSEDAPYVGYPLLVIFLISLWFGSKGVIETIKTLSKMRDTYLKITEEIEKKEKDKEED